MAAPHAPLLPARPRALFRTRSRDEAVESVERLYGPHTLELKSRGVLDMRLSGLDVGTLNLSSIEYGCPATAYAPLPHDHWVFSTCLRGEIMVGPRRARAGYSGVRSPQEICDVPMSADLQLQNLKVECADLDEAWCTLLGERADRPISFLELVPDGSAQTELLRRLMRRLEETPSYPSAHAPLLERRLQEATMLELLMAWPHSHSRYLQRADAAHVALAPSGDAVAHPMLFGDNLAVKLVLLFLFFGQQHVAPFLEMGKAALDASRAAAVEPDRRARQRRKKAPVMADDHQRGAARVEIALQPLDGGEVEMVGRLVEQQDIRRRRQHAGQ